MISPWQIYWVMQLDTIGTAAGFCAFFGIAVVGFFWFGAIESDGEEIKFWMKLASLVSFGWIGILLVAIFLPSSKTAAAMVVIPAIANNEKFQSEASELYELAKDGLKKLVAEEPKKDEP